MPSEQPREGTRVESGTSIEEAERLAAIETDAVFGPAQPQPRGEEARAERIAKAFHAAYESLAPEFDYETRPESRVQLWADVPEKNRALMVGTVERLIATGVLDPAPPRGEGDDLAARLEEKARAESDEFGNYHDRYAEGRADAFDEAASALRASTHPEQSARVELLETALLPFALAHEQRDDDSTVGGPPVAVQVGGQTHGDDPWEFAARALELAEGDR